MVAPYRLYSLGSCLGKRVGARIGCGRRASVSAIRGIGGSWSGEPVVAGQSGLYGLDVMQPQSSVSTTSAFNNRTSNRIPRIKYRMSPLPTLYLV